MEDSRGDVNTAPDGRPGAGNVRDEKWGTRRKKRSIRAQLDFPLGGGGGGVGVGGGGGVL